MKKIFQLAMTGMLFAVAVGNAAAPAAGPDPVVGTWKLNLEKSKYSPGPAPKSQTRTYAEAADGIALSYSSVAADGSTETAKSTYKYDGKDYPIAGSAQFDTLSLERINANMVKAAQKKSGKVVGSTVRTVSAGGKTLTLNSESRDAKGVKHHDVMVFDKQ